MRYRGRRGFTLLEVLVSIFIMGVGLLALLTLFPLGAMSMARALQDDRAAQAANVAAEQALAKDLRHDSAVIDAFLDPAPGQLPTLPQNAAGPSYPVLVDPYAVTLGSQFLGQPPNAIPRRNVSWIRNAARPLAAVERWFRLQDDMNFADDGSPVQPFEKGGRYTWAYLLRRPRASSDAVVDLWVIVHSGRVTELLSGEDTYPAQGAKGTNSVVVSYGTAPAPADRPATRAGGWILDVTADPSTGVTQGQHYRVVNVTDGGAGQVVLEVEPPLKADMTVAVVMENVIEVFEKGSSWLP
jgi:prepilin-type N-terminal cleavage/methylation domain-containing protein